MSSDNEKSSSDMVFEKYYPQHPLPKEIREMDKSETICQFCGISYLIHSEIKRLEDEIIQLHKRIKEFEDIKLSEKQFENKFKELLNNFNQLSSINSNLTENNLKLKEDNSIMKDKFQKNLDEMTKMQSSLEIIDQEKLKYQTQAQNYLQGLFELGRQMRKCKEDLVQIRGEIKLMMTNWQNCNVEFASIDNMLYTINQAYSKEMDAKSTESTQYQAEITQLRHELQDQLKKYEDENKKINQSEERNRQMIIKNNQQEHKIKEYEEERSTKIKIIDELHKQIEEMSANMKNYQQDHSSDLDRINKESGVLKSELNKSNQENVKLKKECDELKHQLSLYDDKFRNISDEINKYKLQEQQLNEKMLLIARNNDKTATELLKFKENERQVKKTFAESENQLIRVVKEKDAEINNLKTNRNALNEELKNLKIELAEKEELTENLNVKVKYYVEEIQNLKKIIKDFEIKMSESQKPDENKQHIIQELECEITNRDNLIEKIERDLISKIKEVETLKATIHKECEERIELSEALNKAREQLLLMGNYTSKSNRIDSANELPPIDNIPTKTQIHDRNSSIHSINSSTSYNPNHSASSQDKRKHFRHDSNFTNITGNSYIERRKPSLEQNNLISTKRRLEKLFNK